MRKKYLSALLFGALLFASAGTFTSCKDYDDDINNLQSQIDSQKSDLQSKLDAINTSLSSLESAKDELNNTIQSLNSQIASIEEEAEKNKVECQAAIAEAQKQAIETASAELAATKAELEKTIQDATAGKVDKEVLEAEIDAVNSDLSKAVGRIAALETTVANTTIQIEELQKALESADASLKGSLDEVKASLDKVSEDYAKADEALGARIDALNTTLQDQGKRLSAIETQIATLDQYAKAETVAANTADIEKAKEDLLALQARVEKLEAGVSDADFAKIEEMIKTKIDAALVTIDAAYSKMITHVSLAISDGIADNNDLHFETAIEKVDFNFGEGYVPAGQEMAFKKGNQVQTAGKFLIRVSPATAEITPDMISLVNSKGETLDGMVKITDVKRYSSDDYITIATPTRAASAQTGIWEVSAELINYDETEFNKISTVNGKSIAYAVSINSPVSTSSTTNVADRNIVSTYDLAVTHSNYEPQNGLYYFVDDTDIQKIYNRYSVNKLVDYKWKDKPQEKPIYEGNVNVAADPDDYRHNISKFPYALAVQGQPFTVSLTAEKGEKVDPTNIKAMFVTLDTKFANLEDGTTPADPSELNAWEAVYTYDNLNKVVEGTSVDITINSKDNRAINDVIGFRVFAVNYDGTLVDPDGKAFYVKVGEEGIDWNAANVTLVPQSVSDWTASANLSGLKDITGAATATLTTDKIKAADGTELANIFDVTLKANKDILLNTINGTASIGSEQDFSKVTSIEVTATKELKYYEDGKTYSGTLVVKNKDGFTLATLKVNFTKNLPEGLPEGFSVKTGQVDANGVYNCYLNPLNATTGEMALTQIFNFPVDDNKNIVNAGGYSLVLANSSKDKDGKYTENLTIKGADKSMNINADIIEDGKLRAATASYNYGQISSNYDKEEGYVDYTQKEKVFDIKYRCIYNSETYHWAWATAAQLANSPIKVIKDYYTPNSKGEYKPAPVFELTYGQDFTIEINGTQVYIDNFIFGTSDWDNKYNQFLRSNKNVSIQSATLTTKATGVEEYFTVELAKENGNNHINSLKHNQTNLTNPIQDVPSVLKIVYKDMYGHERTISIDVVVKPRK